MRTILPVKSRTMARFIAKDLDGKVIDFDTTQSAEEVVMREGCAQESHFWLMLRDSFRWGVVIDDVPPISEAAFNGDMRTTAGREVTLPLNSIFTTFPFSPEDSNPTGVIGVISETVRNNDYYQEICFVKVDWPNGTSNLYDVNSKNLVFVN